ncbi:PLD6 hydrolase, partial [Urocolius indicus]|nr:PLD6 hydrolase [Urocolius indicus]
GGGAMRPGLALAAGLTLAVAPAVALAVWRRRRRPVREVLFFPSQPSCTEELLTEAAHPGVPAPPCLCPLPRRDSSFTRLLRRLLAARRCLDVCLFTFSCPQLGYAVVLLHRRGICVRVVTDELNEGLEGSQIGSLRLAGIQVRHNQDGYMHHKFAIVDGTLLMTGSLNWTTQAIQSNRENVLVVDDVEFVKAFQDEFERIWEECNP